jgi:hypothetical protein
MQKQSAKTHKKRSDANNLISFVIFANVVLKHDPKNNMMTVVLQTDIEDKIHTTTTITNGKAYLKKTKKTNGKASKLKKKQVMKVQWFRSTQSH